ncbi:hypothetical protein ACM9XA_11425 [Xanthomonas sacchari]
MATDSVQEKMHCSVTLRQWEKLSDLVKKMAAVCDVFSTEAVHSLDEENMNTLGMVGFDAGFDAKKLLEEISTQRIGEGA